MTTESDAIAGPKGGAIIKCLASMNKGETPVVKRIRRRLPGPTDVGIEVLFCGICHSDIHSIDNDWGVSSYPLVPGHEIVGIVKILGKAVEMFSIGERVGAGYFCDCCRKCRSCRTGQPQYCKEDRIMTFNSKYKRDDGEQTLGGFSTFILVDKCFVFRMPTNLPMPPSAPLLCAGVSVYSPMRYCKIGRNSHVAVVGIGGLGHLAVKIARALGARVLAISHTADKREEAKRLGADEFILLTDKEGMQSREGTINLIIDTVSARHDVESLLTLLDANGGIAMVGAGTAPQSFTPLSLIPLRKAIFGTCTGSPCETRELLQLCSRHNITADVEVITVDELDSALKRLRNNDVHYRFVLDVRTLKDGYKEWLERREKEMREKAERSKETGGAGIQDERVGNPAESGGNPNESAANRN